MDIIHSNSNINSVANYSSCYFPTLKKATVRIIINIMLKNKYEREYYTNSKSVYGKSGSLGDTGTLTQRRNMSPKRASDD